MSHRNRLTRLVGRDIEIADLRQMLLYESDVRLITLTGPGGVGKTRLAMEVMDDVATDFGEDVQFVDLSIVRRATEVSAAVATTLNLLVAADQDVRSRVLEHVSQREMLLVLDNFEHVMDAESFVWDLLTQSPRLVVLITSREPLRLDGQRVYDVKPLDVPQSINRLSMQEYARYPAVQLFVERARAARPDFALSDASIGHVIEICQLLNGLPLAVELAAARLRHMSIQELSDGLDHMLDLLSKGPPSGAERHRTLRTALTWSYDLLTPTEQWTFRCFSVFCGGFTIGTAGAFVGEYEKITDRDSAIEAGRDVCDSGFVAIDRISSLVDKSLVAAQDHEDGITRYLYLEPIRQFALEQLRAHGDDPITHQAHAQVFLNEAEVAFPHLREEHPMAWIARLDREQSNLREALRWATSNAEADSDIGLRIANALWLYWHMRGQYHEAMDWLEKGLARSNGELSAARGDALLFLGHTISNDEARSRGCYEESRRIYHGLGDKRSEAGALSCLGLSAEHTGEYELALQHHQESLDIFRRHGNDGDIAHAEHQLGSIAATVGNYSLSRTHYERARRAFERLGRMSELAYTLLELGRVAGLEGRFDEAENLLLWSLNVFRKNAIVDGEGRVLYELGMVSLGKRDLNEAGDRFRRTVLFYQDIDIHSQWRIAAAEGLCDAALAVGQSALAVRLLSATAQWRDQSGNRAKPVHQRMLDRVRIQARRVMSERAFAAAWGEGALPLSLEASIELAISLWSQPSTASEAPSQTKVGRQVKLSPMQRVVLCRLADGKSNQQIADDLGRSLRTVTTHVTAILRSLDTVNRASAAAFAIRSDLCPPP